MVQQCLLHHRSSSRLNVVFVPIQLEWESEGKVVTETTTETHESNDDKDFAKFGLSGGRGGSPLTTGFSSSVNRHKIDELAAKAALTSSDEDEEDNSNFEDVALKSHNDYRKRHGCPPLTLDKKLCQFAQEWANKLAREGRFDHRPGVEYGENLYLCYSSSSKAKCPGNKAVDSWYSEGAKHKYGPTSGSSSGTTGHFTQVVWKASTKLGIAKAQAKDGKVIVVANYEPAGNFLGKYGANVPPPISK